MGMRGIMSVTGIMGAFALLVGSAFASLHGEMTAPAIIARNDNIKLTLKIEDSDPVMQHYSVQFNLLSPTVHSWHYPLGTFPVESGGGLKKDFMVKLPADITIARSIQGIVVSSKPDSDVETAWYFTVSVTPGQQTSTNRNSGTVAENTMNPPVHRTKKTGRLIKAAALPIFPISGRTQWMTMTPTGKPFGMHKGWTKTMGGAVDVAEAPTPKETPFTLHTLTTIPATPTTSSS